MPRPPWENACAGTDETAEPDADRKAICSVCGRRYALRAIANYNGRLSGVMRKHRKRPSEVEQMSDKDRTFITSPDYAHHEVEGFTVEAMETRVVIRFESESPFVALARVHAVCAEIYRYVAASLDRPRFVARVDEDAQLILEFTPAPRPRRTDRTATERLLNGRDAREWARETSREARYVALFAIRAHRTRGF